MEKEEENWEVGGERGHGEMESMGSSACFSRNKANHFPGRRAVQDTNKMNWNLNRHQLSYSICCLGISNMRPRMHVNAVM